MSNEHENTITKLQSAEENLQKLKQEIASLKKSLPPESVQDYSLKGINGDVKLSDLFGDKSDLILIHNMGKSCPYCTLWADGFMGLLPHFKNRAAFVVVSPDDPATQKEFADGRGWKFQMISAQGSTFTKDMGYETDEGYVLPGYSTFHKDKDGKITRITHGYFGPGDDYCGIWHMFELLKDGAGEWQPGFSY